MSVSAAPQVSVRPTPRANACFGYDLHGLVAIGLLDASPDDVAVVSAQLGLAPQVLDREPDIVIRFVDRLSHDSPVYLVGLNDAGFTDEAFLVLHGKHKTPARVRIPFEDVGGKCEITCERGLAAVPLLISIINLTMLSRGALPLHASAFRHQGQGVLLTGWAKSGKTEVLLGFTAVGATYLGDEWVYLDGTGMRGIPEPIRLWDWHLTQLPVYERLLSGTQRARLRVLRVLSRWLRRARSPVMHRVHALLERQRYVHLSPSRLFGNSPRRDSSLDTVIFAVPHDSPEITVQPADPSEIADRIVFSLQEERAELMSWYRKFCFAFPNRRSRSIESAEFMERELLQRYLGGTQCYTLHHPYPVPIAAVVAAVRPLFAAPTAAARRPPLRAAGASGL